MIQALLLLAVVALAWYFFANRRKANAKAWVKIGFALLMVAAVWAIARPDDVTVLANWLGVARGTDLMPVSYTHLTLPTILRSCRSRWSPYH